VLCVFFRALTLASPEIRFHIDSETHDPIDVQSKELRCAVPTACFQCFNAVCLCSGQLSLLPFAVVSLAYHGSMVAACCPQSGALSFFGSLMPVVGRDAASIFGLGDLSPKAFLPFLLPFSPLPLLPSLSFHFCIRLPFHLIPGSYPKSSYVWGTLWHQFRTF